MALESVLAGDLLLDGVAYFNPDLEQSRKKQAFGLFVEINGA